MVNKEPFSSNNLPRERTAPYTYTHNYEGKSFTEQVEEVSTTGIIKVPVELSRFANAVGGIDKTVNIYVHSTVRPELIPEEK